MLVTCEQKSETLVGCRISRVDGQEECMIREGVIFWSGFRITDACKDPERGLLPGIGFLSYSR